MDVVENTASYIGILDKGRHQDGKIWRGSKQAPDGIINPSLNNTIKDITNRRRKL